MDNPPFSDHGVIAGKGDHSMGPEKEESTDILGFRTVVGIACLAGLIGGFWVGVWDSIKVIYDHGPPSIALREILLLALYSGPVYAVLGFVAMLAIGVVSSGIIRLGKYSIRKAQLAGVFLGVCFLFGACLLLEENITSDTTSEVIGSTVICTLSAVAVAGLTIYVMSKLKNKANLIALCISSFVSLLALLYGGLWVNMTLSVATHAL